MQLHLFPSSAAPLFENHLRLLSHYEATAAPARSSATQETALPQLKLGSLARTSRKGGAG